MKKSTLKAQLFSAIAMMLVATVALGTSTYAWFVNNATVSVEQMNFQASAAKSLEIGVRSAFATENGTVKFKSNIVTADITNPNEAVTPTNYLVKQLKPASGLLTTTNANTPGTFYADTVWKEISGVKYATEFGNAVINTTGAQVIAIPLTFRASENMHVYLNDPTAIFANPLKTLTTEEITTVSPAQKALAVKVLENGTITVENITKDNYNAAVAKLDTQIGNIKKAVRIAFVSDDVKVIAPDSVVDVSGHRSTIATTENNGTDYTILDVTTPKIIKNVTGGFVKAADVQDEVTVVPDTLKPNNKDADGYYPVSEASKKLFTLEKDKAKNVGVYIWLEGCDADCVSAIASYNLAVKLDFAGGLIK